MLKRVFINGKKVPVPVPVRTLGEALAWIEATLVPTGHSLTRIVLDGRLIDSAGALHSQVDPDLGANARLEVQIDSPADLTVKTLDAMRNLISVILGGIKALAVNCFQTKPGAKPPGLDEVSSDLELVMDLLAHVGELIDSSHANSAPLMGIQVLLSRTIAGLNLARSNSDWKACARLLLNKMEPLFKDFIAETEALQMRILLDGGSGGGVVIGTSPSASPSVAPTGSSR